eukprot:438231_1
MSNAETNDSVAPVKRVMILKPFKRGKQPKGERYSRKDYLKAINDVFQDVPMVIRCIHPVFFIQFKSNEIAADAVKTIRSLADGILAGKYCELARYGKLKECRSKKALTRRRKGDPEKLRQLRKAKRARRAQRNREVWAAKHRKEAQEVSESSETEPSSGPDEN